MKKKDICGYGVWLKDYILGFQDGVVSNLGLVLGVSVATWSSSIVIISGVAAALGEFISMAAVAYTSTEALTAYIKSEKKHGKNFKVPEEYKNPLASGIMVGASNILGSAMAILPFFFLPIKAAIAGAIILCALSLFITGAVRAKLTEGDWFKSGMELLIIGMIAAAAGYMIGRVLGVLV